MGKSLGKQSIIVQRLKVKDLDLNKKLSQSVRDKEGGICRCGQMCASGPLGSKNTL